MARVHCPPFIIFAMIGSAVASDPATSPSLGSMQQAPSESAMLERMLHPNRDKKTLYEGKVFHPSGHFEAKTFQTKEYAGAKQFESKSFASKAFESARESWIGQKLFPQKKLSEKLQGTAPDAGKKFDSKAFATKDYTGLDKQNSYGSKDAFPTKQIAPKGKSQGAIDNDQKLQEAIKKGLTIDDVKNLLNHPSAVRQ